MAAPSARFGFAVLFQEMRSRRRKDVLVENELRMLAFLTL